MFNYVKHSSNTPFKEYAMHVLSIKEFQGMKHRTLSGYKNILNILCPYIGDIPIEDITPPMLTSLYYEFSKEGKICAKTIYNRKVFISTVLSQAVKDRILDYNAASLSTSPKLKKPVGNSFTLPEVTELKKEIRKEKPKWQMIFYIFLSTGIRRGELVGLKWTDIDSSNSSLRICRSVLYTPERGVYVDTPKTDSAYRTIAIPDKLVSCIEMYKEWAKENEPCGIGEYIFTQKDGITPMHPDSISSFFYRFKKRNKLFDVNPHAFRHTMASVLISEGINIVSVSKRLGHSKVSTTLDIYSHVIVNIDKESSDCVSSKLLN